MPPLSLTSTFIPRLNKLAVPYAVTGAVASVIYGEPRLTNDLDMVVVLAPGDIERFMGAFPPELFYCPPPEILKVELKRSLRGHFNLIHHETGFKADIYLAGQDDLHRWALQKRREVKIEGESLWVAPPEYVILRKLEYYREGGSEKHLRDIVGMLEVSGKDIDLVELEARVGRYGLDSEWEKARKSIGAGEATDEWPSSF